MPVIYGYFLEMKRYAERKARSKEELKRLLLKLLRR